MHEGDHRRVPFELTLTYPRREVPCDGRGSISYRSDRLSRISAHLRIRRFGAADAWGFLQSVPFHPNRRHPRRKLCHRLTNAYQQEQGLSYPPTRHRASSSNVAIPKLRTGAFFPDWLLVRRSRTKQALDTVIARCYFQGESARRLNEVVATLGKGNLSKS